MHFLNSILLSYWLPLVTANGVDSSTHAQSDSRFGIDTVTATDTDADLTYSATAGVDASEVDAMVDNLNSQYANGKPSNDYGEIGVVLRMIDG